jgi:uncharacterized protein
MTLPPVDTHDFTRLGESASGRLTPDALPRLRSMLVSSDGELDWQLDGRSDLRADGSRESFMDLRFTASLTVQCARCLEQLEIAIADRHTYRLVGSETQAEREDADDDEHDLLVSSRRFDLAGLIEDEAIMALPSAPHHPDCQAPLADDAQDAGSGQEGEGAASPDKPSPFASLASLRTRR